MLEYNVTLDNQTASLFTRLGAIQVLRNADGGGGGVSDFPEKSVTQV